MTNKQTGMVSDQRSDTCKTGSVTDMLRPFDALYLLDLKKTGVDSEQERHRTEMSGVREQKPMLSSGRLRANNDDDA